MADYVKAKKAASLSAARKKLKEYQQNHSSKKPQKNVSKEPANPTVQSASALPQSNENETPVDSLASSTHSSINAIQELQMPASESCNAFGAESCNNGMDYFNTALFKKDQSNHVLSNYFDTLSTNTKDFNNFNQHQQISTEDKRTDEPVNTTGADPFDFMTTSDINLKQDVKCQSEKSEDPRRSEDSYDQIDPHPKADGVEYNYVNKTEINTGNTVLPVSESAFVDSVTEATPVDNQKTTYSNAESLRQLSSQLTSLIDAESVQSFSENNELESRNQELAALLDKERQKNEQLNLQLREYLTRINQLETESQQVKNEYEAKISREMGPMQEQLQYHVQTVGILVGEKTELTVALNKSQAIGKQKTSECEELQGRLRASRHRVSELEKEVNALKSIKENVDKNEHENNREIERLKLEYGMLKDQFEEVTEEANELREKLNIKINDTLTLQQEIQDKNSQLSLAQLRIQQLTVGESLQAESQLEMLNQQKISLEQQVAELTQTVKLVSSERDQASQQYQQYVQQLNTQLQNLAGQLQEKSRDYESLSKREQSLVKHVGELEKHLQQSQVERQNVHVDTKTNEMSAAIKKLEEDIKNLESERIEIENKQKEKADKIESMEKELLEKMTKIEELEFKVEQMTLEQPDATKLLAAMESDKIAASRATEQNQKLKDQLVELQEGFVKMSNSKLELTEKLESEQYHCHELTEKLSQKEVDVENLLKTITFKDKELTELQTLKTEMSKQILQQNQVLDRIRHYEAQGNVMDMLQQELKEAKNNLAAVMTENDHLNQIVMELQSKVGDDAVEGKESEVVEKSEVIGDINESIRKKIMDLENMNAELEETIKEMSNEENHERGKSSQYLDKEKAMEQLEERFKMLMKDIADMTEEKQRLEHLVLQLQSETETIGEYVTLYQCQRAALKQKTIEKDEQLERLERDRQEMKVKLEELNSLIKKLMLEKGDIPEEILNNKFLKNLNVYCELHANKENVDTQNVGLTTPFTGTDNENNNLGTAGQIIALLSEIKTSNLVQPNDNIQNFHPCPWCSGKLITV